MLLEFSVANYRSIAEQQTLSMIASNRDHTLPGNSTRLEQRGLNGVRVLKSAAVYGSNASGKSNVIKAMAFFANLVARSAVVLRPGADIPVVPFCLSDEWCDAPSSFSVVAVVQGVRYDYRVDLTRKRVLSESLTAYPKGSPQNWYMRTWNGEKEQYEWPTKSPHFKLDAALKSKVRDNTLLLSVGPQFNQPQLTPLYEWFDASVFAWSLGAGEVGALDKDETARAFSQSDSRRHWIEGMMRAADLGLVGADVTHTVVSLEDALADIPVPEGLSRGAAKLQAAWREMVEDAGDVDTYDVRFVHKDDTGRPARTPISYDDESDGTKRYFSLLGPWIEAIEEGQTLFLDELETSLHPLLVQELLRLVNDQEFNRMGAQVVFTTHSPLLLDRTLLRRDQIWFTEKLASGQTRLYPLSDFAPRKNESLLKGYLSGRYGAIPLVPDKFGAT